MTLRHVRGSNNCPLANRHQVIPLRYCAVAALIIKRIVKLSIYEKFKGKRFQKGSAKLATASNLRSHEKVRAYMNLRALQLQTATELLLY